MTQDDVFRKVGRGGAGNFFSKSTADAQEKTEKDLEAQKDTSTAYTADATSNISHPARAGRGGAGNYTESHTSAAEHERNVAQETAKAVKASRSTGPGYSGRGGAGNWKGDQAQKEGDDVGERSRLEEMERKAREAVDQGLKMPEKAITAKDRKKDGEF